MSYCSKDLIKAFDEMLESRRMLFRAYEEEPPATVNPWLESANDWYENNSRHIRDCELDYDYSFNNLIRILLEDRHGMLNE